MYSNQGLGVDRGARATQNPWQMRQEAGAQDQSEAAVKVQGIQNDFIFDKFSMKWLPMPNSNEMKALSFKFEVKSPSCHITFYQKVQESAEIDPTTQTARFISFNQVNLDNAGVPGIISGNFPQGNHEFQG